MHREEIVREEIRKAKALTKKPFGVNVMLMSPYADDVAKVVVEEGVKVVTTGAGNPAKYMKMWKEAGIIVIPVVASVALAKLMERGGADAVVAEGTESGGHIGEATTMTLVPQVVDAVSIPGHRSRRASVMEEESRRPSCWALRQSRWEQDLLSQRNPSFMKIISRESLRQKISIPR